MKYVETIISSILAGICIGIGGTIFLMSELTLAGAVMFSIGLLIICSFDLALFTGQIGYIFQKGKEHAINIPIVLAGNLFGAWIMSLLVRAADMVTVSTRAAVLSQYKLDHGFGTMFFLAILCNVMIYIAVEGYRSINNQVGKYAVLVMSIAVFVYCGFEHSIANMFYYSLAGFPKRSVIALLVIIVGNAVGGIVSHNAHLLAQKEEKATKTSPIEDMFQSSSFDEIPEPEVETSSFDEIIEPDKENAE